ncbi:metalloregulator ArsR/SmtB family transcription factor [Paenibacillus doosanensis]|uniref:Transcriptional repressor SdpR n=1 Tax=Paenibacillus konkukensis TaxID=2020716 RepID=A0ABY4S0P2_9BACL|nr:MULTISPECIES: metalloregulator ArsR/SmtB family transcription factor [Paenibacillus]MCS7460460.1 metalloregulator ArsR/SmtB family transcription factor [Paenibacillus doosanensis]UQZ87490.1 Transcriptional repressor SdpR [Paenibacillus konkukensis]
MQLDKVVNYHKALADPTRIKILILLAEGEVHGLLLAEKLFLSAATITHHCAKLREAGLINERREKNVVYFSLNHYFIQHSASATAELIYRNAKQREEVEDVENNNERLVASVIKNFFTADGKLKHVPAQLKKKLIVLEYMVSRLEQGKKYTEKEINEFIKRFHDDFATIRREFIMHQFLFREQEIYEVNPRELWARWESLS